MSKLFDEEYEAPTYLADIGELIEHEFDNFALDKRGKEYKKWREEMNNLVKAYNKQAGNTIYKQI